MPPSSPLESRLLRALGAPGLAALPFLDAAARQLAAPAGPAPGGEEEAGERVAALLELAAAVGDAGGGPEAAGVALAEDPVLLAVFFQNVDLLYAHGYPGADAVSLAVMEAIGLLEGPDAG